LRLGPKESDKVSQWGVQMNTMGTAVSQVGCGQHGEPNVKSGEVQKSSVNHQSRPWVWKKKAESRGESKGEGGARPLILNKGRRRKVREEQKTSPRKLGEKIRKIIKRKTGVACPTKPAEEKRKEAGTPNSGSGLQRERKAVTIQTQRGSKKRYGHRQTERG